MFVGTSPAFDLAMFSTCFIRGNTGLNNCDCRINAGGVLSNVQMTVIEDSGKVVTAYPTDVTLRKFFIAIITNFLLQLSLKTQTTSTY